MDSKVCTKCNTSKPTNAFGTRKRKDSIAILSICRDCSTKYKRKHRLENKERYGELASINYTLNKERIQEYKKEWYNANKAGVLAREHKRYRDNIDTIKAANKEYRQTDKGKLVAKEASIRYYTNESNKIKIRARGIVNDAIQSGKLVNTGVCSKCEVECVVESHHEDYTKPLDVVWLCKKCHEDIHHLNEGQ